VPVKQLATPCWYARYDGGEEYQNDIHYDTSVQAHRAAKEIRSDASVETGRMDAPCWTARCNGCGSDLEDADGRWARPHFALRSEAETEAGEYGWIVTTDGTVLCDGCAPGCDRADLAVTEQVPGQAVIDIGYLSLPAGVQSAIEEDVAGRRKGGSGGPQA
jgi:hypothetical protein